MPTYDYICSNCGKTSEIVHSINAGPPAACPACGAVGTLRKAFNPPTIHFKGSGWAKKDRSGGHSRPARSGETSSGNGSGGGGGEPGSDSSHDSGGDTRSSGDSGNSGGASSTTKDGSTSGQSKGDSRKSGAGATKDAPAATSSSGSAD